MEGRKPIDLGALEDAWAEQTEAEKRDLGTLRESQYWVALRKILLRMQSQAIEAMAPLGTAPEVIAASQGKLEAVRDLLDLLEHRAPRMYEKALEAEERSRSRESDS